MNSAANVSKGSGVTFKTILDMAQDSAKINQIKQAAERILDVDYDLVYDFFSDKFVEAENYEYIIVKVRRNFVLAQVFCAILLSDTSDVAQRKKYEHAASILRSDVFVSSPQFLFEVKPAETVTDTQGGVDEEIYCTRVEQTAKILVLDDIIIHGRALSQLVDYLVETGIYSVGHIIADSIVVCKDAECVTKNLETCLSDANKKKDKRAECGVNAADWKLLSNKFVEIIQHTGLSYAAFIDAYNVPGDLAVESKLPYNTTDVSSGAQKKADISMELLYSEPNFKLNTVKECLRVYTQNTEDGEITRLAIPFVELPFQPLDCWRAQYKKMKTFSRVNCVNNSKGTHGSVDVYAYKLVSNLYSNNLAKNIGLVDATTNNLLYSFGFDTDKHKELIDDFIDTFVKPTYDKVADSDSAQYNIGVCADKVAPLESVRMWRETVGACKLKNVTAADLNNLLMLYLEALNTQNEKRAAKKENRLQGMPITALFEIIQYYNKKNNWDLDDASYWSFYAYIITLWDVGIANYSIDVYKCGEVEYIGGCITDGEQAYHAVMEPTCASEVYTLHLMRCYTHNREEFMCAFDRVVAQNRLSGSWLNIKKLQAVRNYYDNNQTIRELLHAYPATEREQQRLRQYIGGLISVKTSESWI